MIDHFTLTVEDLDRSRAFYQAALAPLGYALMMDFGEIVGFGDGQKPTFWVKEGPTATQPMHLAFRAASREAVDHFHAAALEAGARDDGAPGIRQDYHPSYYAAFVVDLDGHPIEAVNHAEEKTAKRATGRKAAPVKRPPKKVAPKGKAAKKATAKPMPKKGPARKAARRPAKAKR